MCAQFSVDLESKILYSRFNIFLPGTEPKISAKFLPYQKAPVVISEKDKKLIRWMNFSLVPSWSKDPKVKFATHNARLFSIDNSTGAEVPITQKPTWKTPFQKNHCIVPISTFVEPIYLNEFAGNMVAFKRKDSELLWAAGIWDNWLNKSTGEILESFSILTDNPIKYVREIGHDRSPVFISPDKMDYWLNAQNLQAPGWIKYLRENIENLDLTCEIDRPLAKGWEKRIPKEL